VSYRLRRITQDSLLKASTALGADGYFALEQQKERIAQESGRDVETVTHLLNRYGSLISEICTIAQEPKLAKKLDAQIFHTSRPVLFMQQPMKARHR